MKKLTLEDFLQKALEVHGSKYDYSKVNYTSSQIKITIICSEHGEFEQTPNNHLQGFGCSKCKYAKFSLNRSFTKEQFIEKAKNIHRDKYNYDKVIYKGIYDKVSIVCPKHGEFQQTPNNHLAGSGCSKCSGNYRYSTEEFIRKAKLLHEDRYDYTETIYKELKLPINIKCPVHGSFSQRPDVHLRGSGCSECDNDNRRNGKNVFIEKSKAVHRNKYNYSKVIYINKETKVTITCPVHGDFEQRPGSHIRGCGCNKCGEYNTRLPKEDFIKKAKLIHDNRYDYSKVNYCLL